MLLAASVQGVLPIHARNPWFRLQLLMQLLYIHTDGRFSATIACDQTHNNFSPITSTMSVALTTRIAINRARNRYQATVNDLSPSLSRRCYYLNDVCSTAYDCSDGMMTSELSARSLFQWLMPNRPQPQPPPEGARRLRIKFYREPLGTARTAAAVYAPYSGYWV